MSAERQIEEIPIADIDILPLLKTEWVRALPR